VDYLLFFNPCFECALRLQRGFTQKTGNFEQAIGNDGIFSQLDLLEEDDEKETHPIFQAVNTPLEGTVVKTVRDIGTQNDPLDMRNKVSQLRMKLVGKDPAGTWICINEKNRDLGLVAYFPELEHLLPAKVIVTFRREKSFEAHPMTNNSLLLTENTIVKSKKQCNVKWVGGESSVKTKQKYILDFSVILHGQDRPSIVYQSLPMWLIPSKSYTQDARNGTLFPMDESHDKEGLSQWKDIMDTNMFLQGPF